MICCVLAIFLNNSLAYYRIIILLVLVSEELVVCRCSARPAQRCSVLHGSWALRHGCKELEGRLSLHDNHFVSYVAGILPQTCHNFLNALQEVGETLEKQGLKEEAIEFYNQVCGPSFWWRFLVLRYALDDK
jgi:hypothetical protein